MALRLYICLTHEIAGSNYELSSCKNNGFSITTTTADMNRRASFLRLQEQNPKFPLMRLCVSADGGHRCSLNCRQVTSANVESEAQCAPPEIYDIWFVFCLSE